MSNMDAMRGSSKTLTKNIMLMRRVMGTRGPWKNSIGLRGYHDELMYRMAQKRYRKEF